MNKTPIQLTLPFPDPPPSAPPIEKQTGWRRPYPKMICQETNILLAVTEFDFDLSNGEFCKYLRSRTGWSLKGCEDPDLLEFMITDPGAEQWILESPKYCYLNGNKIPFGKERKQKVKIIQIQKGKIQDCWELFQQHGHLPS